MFLHFLIQEFQNYLDKKDHSYFTLMPATVFLQFLNFQNLAVFTRLIFNPFVKETNVNMTPFKKETN